jgi:predicted nucleic acid-binding protein
VESLARQYGLTACDAAYLELSIRLSVPLATVDEALLRTAPAAGVTIVTGKVN